MQIWTGQTDHGYNLLEIEFHAWRDLLRDVWNAGSVIEGLGYLFMPPGWRAHGAGGTTQDLRRRQLETHSLQSSA
jgi:hypothetical protein